MDFEFSSKVKDLQARLNSFMEEHVYPNENAFHAEVEANRRAGNAWIPTELIESLNVKAREQGLWNLWRNIIINDGSIFCKNRKKSSWSTIRYTLVSNTTVPIIYPE